MGECRCTSPPFDYRDYETVELGVDMTKNRGGEVSVETCKTCGRKWLRYFVEWEWHSESGRWYRGLVTDEMLESVTPESAAELLAGLPWYFYGGSYFRTTGRVGLSPIYFDFL
jgi:hypothetical protein